MTKDEVVSQSDSTSTRYKANWCGLVAALAVVLTALNAFPPADVYYRVTTELVVSSERVQAFENALAEDKTSVSEGQLKFVQLVDLNVLDKAEVLDSASGLGQPPAEDSEAEKELALLQVNSLWTGSYTNESHKKWLVGLGRVAEAPAEETELARENRYSKWLKSTSEHYLRRHDFIASASHDSAKDVAQNFAPATGTRASLASFSRPVSEDEASQDVTQAESSRDVRQQLELKVEEQRKQADAIEARLEEQQRQASGVLRFANRPQLSTGTGRIATWLTMSTLFLGVFSGAIARWAYLRLQSGGAWEPALVAEQLAKQGIPTTENLVIVDPSRQDATRRDYLFSKLDSAGRMLSRNLILFAEVVLGIWTILIAYRLLLDSLWREALYESPLVALAHVLSGMP
ncbi:MAG: hypothetical protein AB8B50_16170 [Pirellulaceae bacterium]